MGKKYIACVMNKYEVGEESYIFAFSHVVTGTKEKDGNLLIDRNGNAYYPITSTQVLRLSTSKGYHNILELDRLQEKLQLNTSLEDAIYKYESLCKKFFYYIGKDQKQEYFLLEYNRGQLKARKKNKNHKHPEVVDYLSSSVDFKKLNMSILEGEFSASGLKALRDSLVEDAEKIDHTLLSIDSKTIAEKRKIPVAKVTEEDVANYRRGLNQPIPSVEKWLVNPTLALSNIPKTIEDLPTAEEEDQDMKVLGAMEYEEQRKKNPINIKEIFQKVTKTVRAQDEPAERFITEIARKDMSPSKKKSAILLTGDTGVGKSLLVRTTARHTNRHFFEINTSSLTQAGFKGRDLEEELYDLYLECNNNIHEAENAIICFTEIDKRGSENKSDVNGQGVLNALLTFIEGANYTAVKDSKMPNGSIKINTHNMTIVLSGAFTDVYDSVKKENTIGFSGDIATKDTPREPTMTDFIEKAMMPKEFMGRCSVIKLNDLDEDDIIDIMLHSDESDIIAQQKVFNELGVKIKFTDGFFRKIAKNAIEQKSGARGINSVIDESTWKAVGYAQENADLIEEIIFTEDSVGNPENYQKVLRRKKSTRES